MGWDCVACGGGNVDGTRFCGHCGTPSAESVQPARVEPRPEERRLVTVVFADISGFTSLAERLDPEQLVDVMDPVLARLSDVVIRHGGQVNKYAGDALLAFFGAPVTREDDAARALSAALDMRAEMAALQAELPAVAHDLDLHIGVNTGHVVTGGRVGDVPVDYSLLGDAVNVAQRLEAAAPKREIFVGDLTKRLVGAGFRFEAMDALTVKGKAEPVLAWLLVGPAVRDERPPADAAVPLAGRERELAVIKDVLSDVVRVGNVHVVGLVGDPGVGKSRLLEEVRLEAESIGFRWLAGRCVSYGEALPHRPYVELLHHVVGARSTTPTDDVAGALRGEVARVADKRHGAYLAYLVGGTDVADIPEHILGSPEVLRHRVEEAVIALLVGLSKLHPTVVAIEDVHWSDTASIELTRALSRVGDDIPLAVVATLRPEGRSHLDELSAPESSASTVVELTPLGRDGVRAVIADVVGGDVADDLLDFVVEHTDGNALFVQEAVRSLLDTDRLSIDQAGRTRLAPGVADLDVPPTIEAVLASRIDLLTPSQSELLQTAAVIGRDVSLPLLAAVLDRDEERLDAELSPLVDRGFVHRTRAGSEQRVTFHHALVVSVAYSRLLRRHRREIHQAVVNSASRLYGTGDDVIGLLAHHAYRGDMGDEALGYLLRAARRAADLYANREAITHLDHALEIVTATGRVEGGADLLLLDKADLLARIGESEQALDCYERTAVRHPIRAAVGASEMLRRLGRYVEAVGVVETAEPAAVTAEERTQLLHRRGVTMAFAGSSSESIALLEQALEPVAGSGSTLEAIVRVDLCRVLQVQVRYEEARVHGERAVRILEDNGELARLPVALRTLGGVESQLGAEDPALESKAEETIQRALALAEEVGDVEEQGAALINLGVSRQREADPAGATEYFRRALDTFGAIGLRAGIAAAYCNLASALWELGRTDEMEVAARAGLAVAEEIDNQMWISGALIGIADALIARNEFIEAARAAERALHIAEQSGLPDRANSARESLENAQAGLAGDSSAINER